MKSLPAVMLLVGSLACTAAGEGSAAGISGRRLSDRWTIDFKLSLAAKKERWVFAVDGTTDLPAATVLRARVYLLTVVNDPVEGDREDDDEPLVRDDEGLIRASCRFTAGAGRFHEEVHDLPRKPYSIRYRAKIHYDPEDQTEAVRLRVGDEPFFRKADLRVGTEESYGQELKERLGEATRQLEALEKMGLELRDLAFRRPWDAAAWSRWKEPALAAVGELREQNHRRFAIWAVWIEGQSRMRIGGLCEFLQHGIEAADEGAALREEDRLRHLVTGYLESVEEACDAVGADVPLSPLKSGPALAAYDRALAPLRRASAPTAELRKAHAEAVSALVDLTSLLRVRRRGYAAVNAMAGGLARLRDLVESKAGADELGRAWREHDSAEQEFRAFARLP